MVMVTNNVFSFVTMYLPHKECPCIHYILTKFVCHHGYMDILCEDDSGIYTHPKEGYIRPLTLESNR